VSSMLESASVVVGGAGDKRMLAGLGVLVSSAIIVVIVVKVRATGYSWGLKRCKVVWTCCSGWFCLLMSSVFVMVSPHD